MAWHAGGRERIGRELGGGICMRWLCPLSSPVPHVFVCLAHTDATVLYAGNVDSTRKEEGGLSEKGRHGRGKAKAAMSSSLALIACN